MGDRVRIFDTTLRDGEQAPGFSMRVDEKLALARELGLRLDPRSVEERHRLARAI